MNQQGILRQSFVVTNGKSIDWALNFQKKINPYREKAFRSDYFSWLDRQQVDNVVKQVRDKGYFVFPEKINPAVVSRMIDFLRGLTVSARTDPADIQFARSVDPKSAVYDFNSKDLLKSQEIRKLVMDFGIREIVGKYLGCEPVLDGVWAWLSYPTKTACSASAQLYHFDLDRIRWLKIFVYLNDVGMDNGPHAFVEGTHNDSGRFASHQGRFNDHEVFEYYPKENEVFLTGNAGSVFIEDTLGIHKGCPLQKGERVLLEFQLSVSHFGYPYPEIEVGLN
jgi:hypothetical protein